MAAHADSLDLGTFRLASGEGAHVELDVSIDALEFGGQTYAAPGGRASVRLDLSRTTGAGYALRLRSVVDLVGPCMRCLDAAANPIDVDARELDQPGGGTELCSPYLDDQLLDVRAWAHDALALALPAQILCRPHCAGLCALCGTNLNHDPDHRHDPEPDPRWAKLSELRLD